MFVFLKIAFRNIFRNKVRSILTMLSIVVGVIAVVIVNGFISYTMWGLRESMIHNGIGHVQIYAKGYSEFGEDNPYGYLIQDYKSVLRKVYELPGVSYVAPRLRFQGILSSSDTSAIVLGFGGWSEEEIKLNSFGTLEEGSFISDEDKYGVVIGSGLAKKLKAKVGDYFTLMATTKGGGINAIDVKIKGIVTLQIEEYNNTFMIAPLAIAQEVANVGNSVDRLVIVLKKTEDTDNFVKKLGNTISDNFEFKRWENLATFYFQAKGLYSTILTTMLVIVLSIVIFAIANTMTMNIYDRFREIGTIRALGAKRRIVLLQFITESTLISIIGGTIGIVLGYLIAGIINQGGGIYIPPPPGNAKGYYAFIQPNFVDIILYWLLFISISIVATFIPAYKASKMNIVDALRVV